MWNERALLFAACCIISSVQASLNFGHQASAITFESGSLFVVPSAGLFVNQGTIKKNTGALIEGGQIQFTQGVYATSTSEVGLTGVVDPVGIYGILLQGNGDRFNAEPGTVVDNLLISGFPNRVEGQPVFTMPNAFVLQDSATTATVAINNTLTTNVLLNDGTIVLENLLGLADDVTISSGRVILNGQRLAFGGGSTDWTSVILWDRANDITLNGKVSLSGTWIFAGDAYVNGNGNTLDINDGMIRVLPGSRLTIHNVALEGLKTNNLRCEGDTAALTLEGSSLCLSNNYSFTAGSIEFAQDVRITGTNTFSYQSNLVSTIQPCSRLHIENTTFAYAPGIDNRDLLAMADETSELFLDGSTLISTTTGMRLTKGTLLVDHKNLMVNNGATSVSEGFAFGDGTAANDLHIEIKPAASLDFVSGILDYQNVD